MFSMFVASSIMNAILWLAKLLTSYSVVDSESKCGDLYFFFCFELSTKFPYVK